MQDTVKIDREKYIGGSDIPSIMGLSEFKSRYQLLREKAGLVKSDFNGNKYTEYGNKMESSIRDYINKFYHFENDNIFIEGKHIKTGAVLDYRCHTDGENKSAVLEIKTTSRDDTGIFSLPVHDLLLDNYKDYLVQTIYNMKLSEKKLGVIAVYNRPEDLSETFDSDKLRLYWFTLNEFKDISKNIDEEVERFQADVKRLKENPELTEVDFLPKEIKAIYSGVEVLEKKLAMYKQINDDFEIQKERLRLAMVKAGVTSFRTKDGTLVTAIEAVQSRAVEVEEFDTEKFKSDHPRLFKKYNLIKSQIKSGRKAYLKITFAKEK